VAAAIVPEEVGHTPQAAGVVPVSHAGGMGYSGGSGYAGGSAYHGGSSYGSGYRGGYGYGYRGGYGYGYRGYGYGYGLGFGIGLGFGLGYPYYGYGYGYPYYGYPYYSSYGSYPSYDAGYYSDPGPVGYSQPAAAAPAPSVNVYTSPAPAREYQAPPPGRNSAGSMAGNQSSMYLFAFPDGSIQVAVAYWTENGNLHFVTRDKQQKMIPLTALDQATTQQLNRERGVTLNFQ
jgi:hypothetical protein